MAPRRRIDRCLWLAVLLTCGIGWPAHAEPVEPASFYFRGGVVVIAPQPDSREVELTSVSGTASLAIQNGPIAGSGVTIDSATIPALIIGYVVPVLDRRLSLETVLGLPFAVKLRATGTLANQSIAPTALGLLPTGIPALGPELGEATVVPPVVTVVYRPQLGRIQPLVGAGIGMLFAYDAHITNPVLTTVSQPDLTISPATGLVLQTGLEARIWENIYARLDLKYIAFLEAHATIENIQVRTSLPLVSTARVGTALADVTVNPLIVTAGLGADF
jgi:outer membrane protein W